MRGQYTVTCVRRDGSVRWHEAVTNVVTVLGRNFLLDKGLAASSWTTTAYVGLISSLNYTGDGVSENDTMTSHASWVEAGASYAPMTAFRRGATWSPATADGKAFADNVSFPLTSDGSVQGFFIVMNPGASITIDHIGGTLFSAAAFTNGPRDVRDTDMLNVAYTLQLSLAVPEPPSTDLSMDVLHDKDLGAITGTVWTDSDAAIQTHAYVHPEVLAYLEFSSKTKVLSDIRRSAWWQTFVRTPGNEYRAGSMCYILPGYQGYVEGQNTWFPVEDPEFYSDRGLDMMSASAFLGVMNFVIPILPAGNGIGQRLWTPSPQTRTLPQPRHIFVRFVIALEPDVRTPDFAELGCKLPGVEAGYFTYTTGCTPYPDGTGFDVLAHHSVAPTANQYAYAFEEGIYDGAGPQGNDFPAHSPYVMTPGVPQTVEMEIDMGTAGTEGGLADDPTKNLRFWLDDVEVHKHHIVARASPDAVYVQIYQGGQHVQRRRLHYRIGGLCVATRKIGIPRELRSGVPLTMPERYDCTWRRNWTTPVGQFAEIPNTSPMNTNLIGGGRWAVRYNSSEDALAATFDNYNGLTQDDDCKWFSWCAGGDPSWWDNCGYYFDLKANTPIWRMCLGTFAAANRIQAARYYLSNYTPIARRTGSFTTFNPVRNQFLMPVCMGAAGGYGNHAFMDGVERIYYRYDRELQAAIGGGTGMIFADPPTFNDSVMGPVVAGHPTTGDIYMGWAGQSWAMWTSVTNTWATFAGGFTCGTYNINALIDITNGRNRFVGAMASTGLLAGGIPYFDLTTKASGALTLTGMTLPSDVMTSATITHDTENDYYYLHCQNAANTQRVYKIHPTTGATSQINLPVGFPAAGDVTGGIANRFAWFQPPISGIAYYARFKDPSTQNFNNVWFMATKAMAVAQPSWRVGLTPFQWTTIAGSSMTNLAATRLAAGTQSSHLPSPINAWCGLAAVDDATRATWVSAAGGGHGDGSDNGVYAIDFLADAPHWVMLRAPSPPAMKHTTGAYPFNLDGLPNAGHNYWLTNFCPQRNLVMLSPRMSLWYTSGVSWHTAAFNLTTNEWEPTGYDVATGNWIEANSAFPDLPATMSLGSYEPSAIIDPATGDYYVSNTAGQWARWDQDNGPKGTYAMLSVTGSGGYFAWQGWCVDTLRNRIVASGYINNGNRIDYLGLHDLATHVLSTVPTGLPNASRFQGYSAITYDSKNDVYYNLHQMATDSHLEMYRCDPTGATTAVSITPPPALPSGSSGIESRFRYFAKLGGIVYYSQYSNDIHFYPTE